MEDSGVKVLKLARPLRDFLLEYYSSDAKIIIDTEKVTIVEEDYGEHFEN